MRYWIAVRADGVAVMADGIVVMPDVAVNLLKGLALVRQKLLFLPIWLEQRRRRKVLPAEPYQIAASGMARLRKQSPRRARAASTWRKTPPETIQRFRTPNDAHRLRLADSPVRSGRREKASGRSLASSAAALDRFDFSCRDARAKLPLGVTR